MRKTICDREISLAYPHSLLVREIFRALYHRAWMICDSRIGEILSLIGGGENRRSLDAYRLLIGVCGGHDHGRHGCV